MLGRQGGTTLLFLIFLLVAFGATAGRDETGDGTGHVIVAPIEGTVDLGLAPFIQRVVREAGDGGAAAVLLDINTLGGRIDAAILIRDALVDSEVPTVAFIHPRAISAGAFISLACRKIAIAPGGSIGAATPVEGGGGEMEAAGEKVVSYWRGEMRTTAERNGRRGELAEAMVDRDVEVEGVSEKGKLLTLTTAEALRLGIADFEADSREQVLEQLDLKGLRLVERRLNWTERIARVISNPMLSSMLLSLGFLGLIIELYQPGWGVPGSLGAVCLVLFFFGHYVVRLAGWEELLLFGLGLLLLAVEVFVIPGFGVAGIAGIGLILLSAVLALLGLDFRVSWRLGLVSEATAVVAVAMILVVLGGALVMRLMPRTKGSGFLVLRRGLTASEGYVSHTTKDEERFPVGTRGQAVGELRPSGTARFGADPIDVVSEGTFVKRGTEVIIVAWRSGQAVVRPLASRGKPSGKGENEA